jgi:hypothetical protein
VSPPDDGGEASVASRGAQRYSEALRDTLRGIPRRSERNPRHSQRHSVAFRGHSVPVSAPRSRGFPYASYASTSASAVSPTPIVSCGSGAEGHVPAAPNRWAAALHAFAPLGDVPAAPNPLPAGWPTRCGGHPSPAPLPSGADACSAAHRCGSAWASSDARATRTRQHAAHVGPGTIGTTNGVPIGAPSRDTRSNASPARPARRLPL